METIKQVLMRRDGMSAEDAQSLIDEAVDELVDRMDSGDMRMDIDSEICLLDFQG